MTKQTATNYFYDQMVKIFIDYHENDEANVNLSEAITEAFETAKVLEREYSGESIVYIPAGELFNHARCRKFLHQ
jgi:hypothetical protein